MSSTDHLRQLAGIVSGVAFRSVEIRRPADEPNGPVLVLANHGGGLADIIAVIDACRRFPRFLARDVIWRFPLARQVMSAARAIPVSRREDHRDGADNSSMFASAHDALTEGDLLAIYPEGESVPEPRLAPLRTGAARIALGAWGRGVDTTILPMGLHYFDVSVLRGRCYIEVGESFRISEVLAELTRTTGDLGEVSAENHRLVHAVTDVLAERLGVVVDEYDGWDQRRRYQAAAAVYLRHGESDPGASVDFEDLASIAARIARAPAPAREAVDVAIAGLGAELELLGVDLAALPRLQLTGTRIAAQTGLVLALLPAAAYGLVVNGPALLAVRAVSLTGMAPATAASVKPAVALLAFPTVWFVVARAAAARLGVLGGLALGLAGPASLVATVGVAERVQLMVALGSAARRGRGTMVDQLRRASQTVTDAVTRAIEPAELRRTPETGAGPRG